MFEYQIKAPQSKNRSNKQKLSLACLVGLSFFAFLHNHRVQGTPPAPQCFGEKCHHSQPKSWCNCRSRRLSNRDLSWKSYLLIKVSRRRDRPFYFGKTCELQNLPKEFSCLFRAFSGLQPEARKGSLLSCASDFSTSSIHVGTGGTALGSLSCSVMAQTQASQWQTMSKTNKKRTLGHQRP